MQRFAFSSNENSHFLWTISISKVGPAVKSRSYVASRVACAYVVIQQSYLAYTVTDYDPCHERSTRTCKRHSFSCHILVNSCDFFVPFAISVWFYKPVGL